jgi:plastocyanin
MRMTHARGMGRAARDSCHPISTYSRLARLISAKCITLSWLAFAQVLTCEAGELTVSVTDRLGSAVANVVATATPTAGAPGANAAHHTAVMDQHNLAFLPQVLVVAVGTEVEFPNNDSVSHQVYSFSKAKKFQLPLYKGAQHRPVTFDQAGIVVLGCNIHDQMAAYIYVTDAPFYGTTDAQGSLRLPNVPAGDYLVRLWSPFIADDPANLTRTVHVDEQARASARVQLLREQRSRPEPRPRRADWSY